MSPPEEGQLGGSPINPSLGQAGPSKIVRHAIQNSGRKHHGLLELRDGEVRIVAHQFGVALFCLLEPAGSPLTRRQVAVNPASVRPLLKRSAVERYGLIVFLRYLMRRTDPDKIV